MSIDCPSPTFSTNSETMANGKIRSPMSWRVRAIRTRVPMSWQTLPDRQRSHETELPRRSSIPGCRGGIPRNGFDYLFDGGGIELDLAHVGGGACVNLHAHARGLAGGHVPAGRL